MLKTTTEGMCIPWGLSWFRPSSYENLHYRGNRYLVICIRLPFYYKQRCAFMDMEEVWGSAVFRIAFGYRGPEIVWVPDYDFGRI